MAASAVMTDVVVPRKRFYLSVIDPLLEDPVLWEITKPYTVVGFAEGHGVDFVIPWEDMGIDVLEESKKLDPSFNPLYRIMMDRAGFLNDPEFQLFGANSNKCLEGRDDAYFSLCAEKLEDGELAWWIGSKRRDFSFQSIPTARLADRVEKLDEGTGETRWRVNNAFKFVWNEADLGYYKMAPWQIFRFCILDGEKEKQVEFETEQRRNTELDEEPGQQISLDLLSLPEAVLGRIAGFCSPSELFSSLVLTSHYFTDVLRGHVAWQYVELNESYDSLRAAIFASAEDVTTLVCRELWDLHSRDATWGVWRRLAAGENLTKLVVADLDMLIGVKLGEKIKEFGVCGAYFHSSEFSAVRFPPSVESVTVQLYRLGTPLPELQADFLPSFPNAHTFKLEPCPGTDFWGECRQDDLSRIRSLEVSFRPGSHLPLYRLKNLETLFVNNGTGAGVHVEDLLRNASLPRLTTLGVEKIGLHCNNERKDKFWSVVARCAPAVRHLDVGCKGFDAVCLDGILRCMPGLQYLVVQDSSVTVNKLGEYLAAATNVLFARVTTSTPGVSKQNEFKVFSMLQHLAPAGAFYWQWVGTGNERLKLTVFFSRGYVFPRACHDWQKML